MTISGILLQEWICWQDPGYPYPMRQYLYTVRINVMNNLAYRFDVFVTIGSDCLQFTLRGR